MYHDHIMIRCGMVWPARLNFDQVVYLTYAIRDSGYVEVWCESRQMGWSMDVQWVYKACVEVVWRASPFVRSGRV